MLVVVSVVGGVAPGISDANVERGVPGAVAPAASAAVVAAEFFSSCTAGAEDETTALVFVLLF